MVCYGRNASVFINILFGWSIKQEENNSCRELVMLFWLPELLSKTTELWPVRMVPYPSLGWLMLEETLLPLTNVNPYSSLTFTMLVQALCHNFPAWVSFSFGWGLGAWKKGAEEPFFSGQKQVWKSLQLLCPCPLCHCWMPCLEAEASVPSEAALPEPRGSQ